MILAYIRTIILYLILIFSVRLMGKRQIGQMEPSEFVVTMLVANLATIPMQDAKLRYFLRKLIEYILFSSAKRTPSFCILHLTFCILLFYFSHKASSEAKE